jgi:hypothetical protein
MFQLFRALAARLKALFIAHVALEFESEFAAVGAERRAVMLRQAAEYDKEGLPEVADELRQRAAEIDLRRPLASVLPSLDHWQQHGDTERPKIAQPGQNRLAHAHAGTSKKKRK